MSVRYSGDYAQITSRRWMDSRSTDIFRKDLGNRYWEAVAIKASHDSKGTFYQQRYKDYQQDYVSFSHWHNSCKWFQFLETFSTNRNFSKPWNVIYENNGLKHITQNPIFDHYVECLPSLRKQWNLISF